MMEGKMFVFSVFFRLLFLCSRCFWLIYLLSVFGCICLVSGVDISYWKDWGDSWIWIGFFFLIFVWCVFKVFCFCFLVWRCFLVVLWLFMSWLLVFFLVGWVFNWYSWWRSVFCLYLFCGCVVFEVVFGSCCWEKYWF